MRRRSQGKLRGLCLILLALPALGCGEDPAPPKAEDPTSSLPFWALCANWRRPDHSCDQAALLADYEECMRTEGVPDRQRLLQARVSDLALRRAGERTIIVCLERRRWMMKPAAFQNLPGRPKRAPPPS